MQCFMGQVCRRYIGVSWTRGDYRNSQSFQSFFSPWRSIPRTRIPFCTRGPQPRTFFGFLTSYAKSAGRSPWRYFSSDHKMYLRSFTGTPAPFNFSEFNANIASQSSPTAETHVELFAKSRRGLEIASRNAFGVAILSIQA